jgi:hypothetical protein
MPFLFFYGELKEPWCDVRFGCGNIGHLGFSSSLPVTTLGICKVLVSNMEIYLGEESLELGKPRDVLITTTGACILRTSSGSLGEACAGYLKVMFY